ncbi:hypothetical protein [Treponema endosymbiont of Eucomonympha sp.]|uniref:hypothetical protein n=1 Tax=Treponema endosymbiont of Eucomonympha sp. TaxID=1580831 RepID=UPI00078129C9|nr:hypothetical protein [Treponema endosymbiont of Eucomonympha sp.]
MNAAKRFLTAAVTAGALGIGTGAFADCRQELSPDAQSGSAGAERRPKYAKYDYGDYDFYFRNGAHAGGDCDEYNSEPGGKTTIYEYYQSEINQWEKRLKAAGVNPEMYRTNNVLKHCYARFDTDLLAGIGYESGGWNDCYDDGADVLSKSGKQFYVPDLLYLLYAQPRGGFPYAGVIDSILSRISEAQKERDALAFLFVFP